MSGGGLRATLYHLGVVKGLHELNLLRRVHIVCGTSGGAIMAAVLATYCNGFDEDENEPGYNFDLAEIEQRILNASKCGMLSLYYGAVIACSVLLLICGLLALSLFIRIENIGYIFAPLLFLFALLYSRALYAILTVSRRYRKSVQRIKRLDPNRSSNFELTFSLADYVFGPLRPSFMRLMTLDSLLFEGQQLRFASSGPAAYLSTVDLVSSKQMICSQNVVSDLSKSSAYSLWTRSYRDEGFEQGVLSREKGEPIYKAVYETGLMPTAVAVAASTAFPPAFAPVRIHVPDAKPMSFVDGGVLDNLSVNILSLFAMEMITDRSSKVASSGGRGFETITHCLIADANAPARRKRSNFRTRIGALMRIKNIVLAHERTELNRKVFLMREMSDCSVAAINTSSLPESSPLYELEGVFGKTVGFVRTHLDSFTEEERAALTYSGYAWARDWAERFCPDAISAETPHVVPDILMNNPSKALQEIETENKRLSVRRALRFLRSLM